jgi:glycosyltransferase involved in cell wall biosynthesis
LPLVRRRHPGAVLYLVGGSPPPELADATPPGVIVTGHVPALGPYFEQAAVVAAPLRRGGGMRVKVLEALASGKAVVASPLAADGLDVVDGWQLAIATSDEEFAARIAELFEDAVARRALAERARSWARRNLTWDASIDAYMRLYEEILGEGRPDRSAGVASR